MKKIKETLMSPMIYSKSLEPIPRQILFANRYKGYQFYIMNLGIGPTAYIEIPKGNKFYKVHYNDYDEQLDLNVHGGITFTEDHLIIKDEPYTRIENTWFIGWDYMHWNDYMPIYEKIASHDMKKWTTDEIFEHVKKAIDDIIEINAN